MKAARISFGALIPALGLSAILATLPCSQASAQEPPGDIQIDSSADLQIDQSGDTEPSDSFELKVVFTNNDQNAEGSCDGDDPVTQGLTIALATGTCGDSTGVVSVVIPPFSSTDDSRARLNGHRHHKHRTPKRHFSLKMPVSASDPSTGETETASLDAEITVLPTPAGTCGQWKLDAEVSSVDLSALTANPVVMSIVQGDDSGCNDQIQAQFNNDQGDDNNDQGDNGQGQQD